jgi:hypothetical protein
VKIQEKALHEFQEFAGKLKGAGVEVISIKDTPEPHTPDSIFPNNWISMHEDGRVILYPMYAKNRRLEKRPEIIREIGTRFKINEIINFSRFEKEDSYLEGTGSLVIDYDNKKAYAALSHRTNKEILTEICHLLDLEPVTFTAYQTVHGERKPIYHTNVMMCVADQFVVICLETIDDKREREIVVNSIHTSKKEIIEITEDQNNSFAGNMLQVENSRGEKFLVMSTQAFKSLEKSQLEQITNYCQIIHSDISTIERYGGGSARCMMAEIFLKKLDI